MSYLIIINYFQINMGKGAQSATQAATPPSFQSVQGLSTAAEAGHAPFKPTQQTRAERKPLASKQGQQTQDPALTGLGYW